MNSNYKRDCPRCGREMFYSTKYTLKYADRDGRNCYKCSNKGKLIGLRRRPPSLETRIKMSDRAKNRPCNRKGCQHSEESKRRISVACKQAMTEEKRYKLRLATIKDLLTKTKKGKGNYNHKACKFIDNLNKENRWNLQHAENGGEVELYGYLVDGYDKEKNIIFEYDEPRHHIGMRKKKDLLRQERLIREIHPSIFIRYDEKYNRFINIQS